jgi:hypothetical protein
MSWSTMLDSSQIALAGGAGYSASKAALASLIRTWRSSSVRVLAGQDPCRRTNVQGDRVRSSPRHREHDRFPSVISDEALHTQVERNVDRAYGKAGLVRQRP